MSDDLFSALPPPEKTSPPVEDWARFTSHGLQTANARKCFRCKAHAPFGWMRPDLGGTIWACSKHRKELR